MKFLNLNPYCPLKLKYKNLINLKLLANVRTVKLMVILKPTADIVFVESGAVMTTPHLPIEIHVNTQCDAPSAQVTT